jgi:hypothetical protein
MATYAKFAQEVRIESRSRNRKFISIDGEYFPYYTDGISIEKDEKGREFLHVRIPCDKIVHTFDHADDED